MLPRPRRPTIDWPLRSPSALASAFLYPVSKYKTLVPCRMRPARSIGRVGCRTRPRPALGRLHSSPSESLSFSRISYPILPLLLLSSSRVRRFRVLFSSVLYLGRRSLTSPRILNSYLCTDIIFKRVIFKTLFFNIIVYLVTFFLRRRATD